jgi:hypothetical protein
MLARPLSLRAPRDRVLLAAIGMIVLQLAIRSWGAFSAWFQYDDLAFLSRVLNQPFGWDMLFSSHSSHLMPGGFLATWINTEIAPWNYTLFAGELIVLQAIADVGVLVFLISAFGRRPGILPPLAIFLFTAFTLPADVWWAVGINQTPTIAAFGWAGWTLLTYLRTRRIGWAAATAAITLVALAFQERALLLVPFYLFLTLGYFTTGDIVERLLEAWRRYRAAIVMVAVVCAAYIAFYASTALQFSPENGQDQPFLPLLEQMGLRAVVPAIFGGPIRWITDGVALGYPNPTEITVWLSAGLLAYVSYVITRSRTASARAWWLIALIFGSQVLLVAASRALLVGAQVGRNYRYTTEMCVAVAFALAFALMPVRQAPEVVQVQRASRFLDKPVRVTLATALIIVLSTYSGFVFMKAWADNRESNEYFSHARADLEAASSPTALVDTPLPDHIFPTFSFGFPANMSSHLFRSWLGEAYFPHVATDQLSIAADDGRLKPVQVSEVRTGTGGDTKATDGCRWTMEDQEVTVPLSGAVMGIEWWTVLHYRADSAGTIDITAGDQHHQTTVEPGEHTLYFTAQGDGFDSITIDRDSGDGTFCISDLTLGQAYALGDQAPA